MDEYYTVPWAARMVGKLVAVGSESVYLPVLLLVEFSRCC
jgi:hypothetical protein